MITYQRSLKRCASITRKMNGSSANISPIWKEAGRMNASSVDQVAAAIAQFETSTGHRDFGAFHFEQARKFKGGLTESVNPATGKPLAKPQSIRG
jgi:hypothetical protein